MPTISLPAKRNNINGLSAQEIESAINGSQNFETLFRNLQLIKYHGHDPENESVIGPLEAIALITNSLIHAGLWHGRVWKASEKYVALIDEEKDSKVKIPPGIIENKVFVSAFETWNERLIGSSWPYANIPSDYGLKDKVLSLLGFATQRELDDLNPNRAIEQYSGALAIMTYKKEPEV